MKLNAHSNPTKKAFLFLGAYLLVSALSVLAFAQFVPKTFFWFAWGIAASMGSLLAWRYFLKKEDKPFPDDWIVPDIRTAPKFLTGFAIGLGMIAMIVLLLIYLLPLELVPVNGRNVLTLMGGWAALIFCAFHEEVGFRSYLLKNLSSVQGIWKCQAIIAIIFALYHIAGGQDIINSIFSTSLWSLVFGFAAMYSRGLAMPTGIHAASTIGQACVGMKITDGFGALYVLKPTKIMPDNVAPVVLCSQAAVLIAVIFFLSLLEKRNRPHAGYYV